MKRRVVITGMGIVSPLGIGLDDNWQAICQGKSGIGPITKFDTTEYPAKIAGEVKNFDPELYIDKKDQKKMDVFIQYALAAGSMAIKQSGLKIDESNADRVGVLVGSGLGGLQTIEKYHTMLLQSGPKKISPFLSPCLLSTLRQARFPSILDAAAPTAAS